MYPATVAGKPAWDMATTTPDLDLLQGHSPSQERPLGGYAVLMGAFAALDCLIGRACTRPG